VETSPRAGEWHASRRTVRSGTINRHGSRRTKARIGHASGGLSRCTASRTLTGSRRWATTMGSKRQVGDCQRGTFRTTSLPETSIRAKWQCTKAIIGRASGRSRLGRSLGSGGSRHAVMMQGSSRRAGDLRCSRTALAASGTTNRAGCMSTLQKSGCVTGR